MVSSDLGACEWFVWDLRRSGLIDRGHLDQVVGEFLRTNPRAEPPALSQHLVSHGILSPFQAERILSGKTQGLVLGPYVLADAIGSGSMGQVYKAQSKTDNQWYAVKVLPRRSMWNVRLARRQVRSFSQFQHNAVVPFVDVGTAGGQHYLVWPLVEGQTLETKVQNEGPLAPDETARVLGQIAQGLAASHAQGLFHGLLKPSNIMIGSDGQSRILDFGIGSLLAENEGESLVDTMSTANTLTSGLDCASPESIMEPTNRTLAGDQYSFGCVLYYCLTGQYPFGDGTAVEKMMAHQFKQPTPLRERARHVPEGLAAVVERLMQKSPEARYSGVDELVDALAPFAVPRAGGGPQGGSHHGVGRPGGSHFGTAPSPVAPSRAGQSAGPAPAPIHVPPARPNPASPKVPTPQHGPLTPPPRSKVAPAAPPPPSAPTKYQGSAVPGNPAAPVSPSKHGAPVASGRHGAAAAPPAPAAKLPALPTRAGLKGMPVAAPTGADPDDDLPVAQAVDDPYPARALPVARSVGGWDQPKQARGSTFLVVLLAAFVTATVYVLGKNFLFIN